MQLEIYTKVLEVIRLLRESRKRIVLAESCTGGAVAASFTGVPGVSDVFCGSMVVYRNDSKTQWLGLDPVLLANPEIGPVSPQASEWLARQVLERTPEADVALAVTGHLGPDAPGHLNRRIFVALLQRADLRVFTKEALLPEPGSYNSKNDSIKSEIALEKPPEKPFDCGSGASGINSTDRMRDESWRIRGKLQSQAAGLTLDLALEVLANISIS
ncbi:MAG: CinA family protein [Planctomycetota bacterium]|nr:CinA family protein [Planctomycetota bacterium]